MRVITDDGDNLGVISRDVALEEARKRDLDLVLINPQAKPPVAKIVSWSKFKYDLSKKKKSQKSKTSSTKGMWIKPFIEEGDLNHKLGRVEDFLSKGDKVKLEIRPARGRYADRERMQSVADNIIERMSEFGELEGPPKREGRNLSLYIKPKKITKSNSKDNQDGQDQSKESKTEDA